MTIWHECKINCKSVYLERVPRFRAKKRDNCFLFLYLCHHQHLTLKQLVKMQYWDELGPSSGNTEQSRSEISIFSNKQSLSAVVGIWRAWQEARVSVFLTIPQGVSQGVLFSAFTLSRTSFYLICNLKYIDRFGDSENFSELPGVSELSKFPHLALMLPKFALMRKK